MAGFPAPSSETRNYDALLTQTLANMSGVIADQIGTDDPYLYQLMKTQAGGYESVGALGERCEVPLMYELGQFGVYEGYDVLDTTPMDGVTKAFFDWRQAATPISISRIEERKNSGEYQILNMLKTKTEQAMLGIKEGFAKGILQGNGPNSATAITTAFTSPTNGAVFVDPLPTMVKFDPTTSTSIGNINQSTYTWWRNQFTNSSGSTFAGILKELDHLYNNCCKGPGGAPNFHLLDQSTFELYQAALWAKVQNPSYAKTDYPFETLLFHGQNVFWSQYVPDVANGSTTQSTTSGTWWMLNTKFLKIKYDSQTNFMNTPFQTPVGQDAKTSHIMWYGAHVCSNRRKQGVCGSIDTTVTS